MPPKGKMQSLSRLNFILLKNLKILFFHPMVSHVCINLRCMEYPRARGRSSLEHPSLVHRNHSQQEIIQCNILFSKSLFFKKENFSWFSAENFLLACFSTSDIFFHVFNEKTELFVTVVTEGTFTKPRFLA